jgi:hypothetical protein
MVLSPDHPSSTRALSFLLLLLVVVAEPAAQQPPVSDPTSVQRCVMAAFQACRASADEFTDLLAGACRASPRACAEARSILHRIPEICTTQANKHCASQFPPTDSESAKP